MSTKRVPIAMQSGKVLASLSEREARRYELPEASIEAMIAEDCSPAPIALHSLGARVVMASIPHPEGGLLTLGVHYWEGPDHKTVSLYHVASVSGVIGHNSHVTVKATSRVVARIDDVINALLPYLVKVRTYDVGYQDYYFRFPEAH